MARSRTKRVGLVFVFGGVALYGCWLLWAETRTVEPLRMPISMAVGHVRTRRFNVNLDESYIIEIEVEKKIPFDTLNCLLGTYTGPTSIGIGDCPNRPSVVKATWSLTSKGHVVASGSSGDYRSVAWAKDTISRELGHFRGQGGRWYVLNVKILEDGSALAPGNPQLVVEVNPGVIEGMMVQEVMFFLGSALLVTIGTILLVIAFLRDRRARREVNLVE